MQVESFEYSIPTKIIFGTDSLEKLPECIKEFGTNVFLIYGGGSIKRTGLYQKLQELFKEHGITCVELSGVEANPRISTVRKGVAICKANKIDVILPVGGGSTIDCGKAISAASHYEGDAWDVVMDSDLIAETLPLITISTISATGSEMDPYSVITNEETNQKVDFEGENLYPAYSILNPEYTYSVPVYQTACGVVDIMSHIFEVYFAKVEQTYMIDRMMEGMLKTCVTYGPIACKEPDNYEARANLMWVSEWAINGFIACGRSGPWPAHAIEHQLSAQYDVTHGHGLAVVIPPLMKYSCNEETCVRYAEYGTGVFDIDKTLPTMEIAQQAIARTEAFFQELGLTLTLRELGITEKNRFEVMAEEANDGLDACMVPLDKEQIIAIYNQCF